jgi:hypothetical protein
MATSKRSADLNPEDLPIYTTNGAAKFLDLSGRTITYLALTGKLSFVRDSAGKRMYSARELKRYQQVQKDWRAKRSAKANVLAAGAK